MQKIKTLFFYPLLYLRGLFLLGCSFFSGLLLVMAILGYIFASDIKTASTMLAFSFGFFLLKELYDRFLRFLEA